MELPFDGAISAYFEQGAPAEIRHAIRNADKDEILNPEYPHDKRMGRKRYNRELERLQIELLKMQAWIKSSGARVLLVFEGRDAAGKGGTIRRFQEHMNPRGANMVALAKPSDAERSQWYFQRYITHLPSGGEIAFFDRSWYNRGVVEKVFGFCTDLQREQFFHQVLPFEHALVNDGIHVFKFWLTVGRAEQLSRFLARESDPLKQWKLSKIDVEGLNRWDEYTDAIRETLDLSHDSTSPWTILRTDDKRRARLTAIRHVLHALNYDRKDHAAIGEVDTQICGGPDLWDG